MQWHRRRYDFCHLPPFSTWWGPTPSIGPFSCPFISEAPDPLNDKSSDPSSSYPTKAKSFVSLFHQNTSDQNPQQPLTLIPLSLSWWTGAQNLSRSSWSIFNTLQIYTLVGKFSHGWPTLEKARQCFAKFNLEGNFQLGHLDNKHMLIHLTHEDDFNRLWLMMSGMLIPSLWGILDGLPILDLKLNRLWSQFGWFSLVYLFFCSISNVCSPFFIWLVRHNYRYGYGWTIKI